MTGARAFIFVSGTVALASCVSLIGGVGLELVSERILPLIPLLVALPALNDLVGDYATIIAAHTGDPNERPRTHKALAQAIFRVVGLNILALLILSLVIAATRGYIATPDFIFKLFAFMTIAVLSVVGLMFWVNRWLDRILRKSHLNPDDLLIPISTSIADVSMLGLVTVAVILVF